MNLPALQLKNKRGALTGRSPRNINNTNPILKHPEQITKVPFLYGVLPVATPAPETHQNALPFNLLTNRDKRMKKLLIIATAVATLACGDGASGNGENAGTQSEGNVQNNVEEGSGEMISPQLEQDSVNEERFDVDTVSSADEIHEREKH
ncbi:hypothetical protein [Pontibacter flavimaris]|nr:hypothetical protein [Pontibacter flavimaris]